MLNAWLNFGIVVFAQVILFTACAYKKKRSSEVLSILKKAIPIGIIFGLSFDFMFGKLFGFHTYVLGFSPMFLIINSAISYGLFAASVLLVPDFKSLRFFAWIVSITAIYEIANYFFPVWVWKLNLPNFQFFIALIIGYLVGAIVVLRIERIKASMC